jgi:hypothetical protein
MNFISSYWLAWMAAAAAAAAVPVIIHLIHTARAPQVPFPTLRFLRSAAQKTARRRYLENILLLVLRMLLFAGLAVALARPFVSEAFGLLAESPSSAAVIILDNSYSMNVRFQQDTRFSKVKQEARAILDDRRTHPGMAAVLLTNPGAAPPPTSLSADRAKLFKDIDGAQISSGRADLVGTLKAAYALLDKTGATDKRLWILTDRQALSWQGLAKFEEPARHGDIPVAIIRPTEPSYTNVAVAEAAVVSHSLAVGMPVRIDATIRNGGPAPEKRSILLLVDDFGQATAKETADLAPTGGPGATRVVSFTHTFSRPGPHRVMVAVDGTDSLDVDNTRRLALWIADRVPILLIKQKQADVAFQDDDFYLVRALDPVGAADVPWPIKPVETTAAQFDPAVLEKFDAVILNNVAGLKPAAAKALADFVAGGRTLVVFCGTGTTAAEYNRLFQDPYAAQGGLLPARLKDRVGDPVLKNSAAKVTWVNDRSPYLEGLVDSAEMYQDILVYSYLQTDAAPADAVLARLESGDPLLLEKSFGQGRVLLFTTDATTAGSNLPLRNLFLPLMMRVAHLSARGQNRAAQLVAGQPFQVDLAPDLKVATLVEVSGPLGPSGEIVADQRDTRAAGGRNLLEFDKTWNLGYYAWRTLGPSPTAGVFCTNVDGAESDLTEIADEKLRADVGARETHVAASFAELIARFEAGSRRELWQYILIICLVLAVCEPLVANWMRPDRQRSSRLRPTGRRNAA